MGNRKAAEAVILKGLRLLDPSGKNAEMTKELFASMSDKQFDEYMIAIEEGRDYVSMVYENLQHSQITVENNLKAAEALGHDFWEQIWVTDSATGKAYLTPKKYMVIDLPVRRQIQMLKKKISIPDDNRHIDDLTDQPTGVSKGSSLSAPEIYVLYSKGMDKSIIEMIKYRGGDAKGMTAMDRSIRETGGVNLAFLDQQGTRVKSTQTLSTLLSGMHLDNNF